MNSAPFLVFEGRGNGIVRPRTARERIYCIRKDPWYAGSRKMNGCAGQRQVWRLAMKGADRSGDHENGGSFVLFAWRRAMRGPDRSGDHENGGSFVLFAKHACRGRGKSLAMRERAESREFYLPGRAFRGSLVSRQARRRHGASSSAAHCHVSSASSRSPASASQVRRI